LHRLIAQPALASVPIPEPASLALFLAGGLPLLAYGKARRKTAILLK
jgi:hypothetical protein